MRYGRRLTVLRLFSLTLVLALSGVPAEGLVIQGFPDSRRESARALEMQRAGFAVVTLTDDWSYTLPDGSTGRVSLPLSFCDAPDGLDLSHEFTIPDTLRNLDWSLYIPEYKGRIEVHLNGDLLAVASANLTEMRAEISPGLLRFGEPNSLTVSIRDNLNRATSVPLRAGLLQQRDFAAINSGVFLRGVGDHALQALACSYTIGIETAGTGSDVELQCRVGLRAGPFSVQPDSVDSPTRIGIRLLTREGEVVGHGEVDVTDYRLSSLSHPIRFSCTGIDLWEPDDPVRYVLEASVMREADTLAVLIRAVGFKRVTTDDKSILLNGTPIEVRGIDCVWQSPRGLAPHSETLRSDMCRVQRLGFNTIRLVHDAASHELLSIADSLGLLVILSGGADRVPGQLLTPAYQEALLAGPLMRAIRHAEQHVSVVAITTASWVDMGPEAMRRYLTLARNGVRAQSSVLSALELPPRVTAGELPADVLLLARLPGQGDSLRLPTPRPRMPVIASGIGWSSEYGARRAGDDDSDRQSAAIEEQVAEAGNAGCTAGLLLHAYADYRGAVPLMTQPRAVDPEVYAFGLVTLDRREKPSAQRVRELNSGEESVRDADAEPTGDSPIAFPIVALSALLLFSLYLRADNVFRQNLRRAFRHSYGFFTDVRHRRYLPTLQSTALWATISIGVSVIGSAYLYSWRSSMEFAFALSSMIPAASVISTLARLAWSPWLSLSVLCGATMLLLVLHVILVRLVSRLFRPRVSLGQAWSYTMWGLASLVFLLPVGVVLYRTFVLETINTILVAAMGLILLWSMGRIIGALRNGLSTSLIGVAAVMLVILIAVLGATYVALDHWMHYPEYHEWIQALIAVN